MPLPGNAAGIASAVASRELSATAVVEATLTCIATQNRHLNAFTDVLPARAYRRAEALDAALARGETPGPLAGVCFGAKNLFDIEGLPTRAGSRINRDAPPAGTDALVIQRLEAAVAVLVGALNMGEYACDFTGENMHDGPSRNPHDLTRQTGGSSGGSAAAVAGGMVPLALGTDTNGSIRVPASWCGVFGLKPTYERLPRSGVFPFVESLDHVGPFAATARDLALAYSALTSEPGKAAPSVLPDGLRVASTEESANTLSPEAHAAMAFAREVLGGTRRIELPEAEQARAAAALLTLAEGGALHRDRLRKRGADFTPAIRHRLTAGSMLPVAALIAAQNFQKWYRSRIAALFREVDLLITPATPATAPLQGSVGPGFGPIRDTGYYTRPFNLAGVPAIAVPVQTRPLPIAIQIVAAPRREQFLLAAAAVLERERFA